MSLRLRVAIGILSVLISTLGRAAENSDPFYFVSLVELITQPEKFNSYNITVVGYLPNDGRWLYLTEAHAKMQDGESGIALSFAFSDADVSESGMAYTGCEGQMVRVYGRLRLHSDAKEWEIRDVSKVEIVNEDDWPETCWEKASNKSLNSDTGDPGAG